MKHQMIVLYGGKEIALHLASSAADASAKNRLLKMPRTAANESFLRAVAAGPELLEAAQFMQRVVDEALPKFDWGKSALDGNAIDLLNRGPLILGRALAKTKGGA